MGHVVFDTDGEAVESAFFQVFENSQDHGGGEVFGRETVTAADDGDGGIVDGNFHIHIEGFADGTGFFGAVENGNAFHSLGKCGKESFGVEGSVKTHFDKSVFGSAGAVEVFDGFFNGFAAGTHGNDHIGGIFCTDIVEEMVLTAGDLGDSIHLFLHDCGTGGVVGVDSFSSLEVHVTILGTHFADGAFGTQGAVAEFLDVFGFHKFGDLFIGDLFKFVYFVRGTETVEELEEGNFGFVGGEVCDQSHIHFFLNAVCSKEGETGIAACHHVGVVTEDRQGLAGKRAGSHMEHSGKHFPCDLIHVGDHQKKTL